MKFVMKGDIVNIFPGARFLERPAEIYVNDLVHYLDYRINKNYICSRYVICVEWLLHIQCVQKTSDYPVYIFGPELSKTVE